MKVANVAQTKNELSRLLRRVKRGETVVITERKRPVARLDPISATGPEALASFYDAGVLTPPRKGRLDMKAFRQILPPKLPAGSTLLEAVLSEREEGR